MGKQNRPAGEQIAVLALHIRQIGPALSHSGRRCDTWHKGKLQQSLLCVGQGGVLSSPAWLVFRNPLFEEALEGSTAIKVSVSLELGQRMGNEDIPELWRSKRASWRGKCLRNSWNGRAGRGRACQWEHLPRRAPVRRSK